MKKTLAILLVFALSANQVGQSCIGENVNSVAVAQKEQGEHGEKETSQQELNEKVLARIHELEAEIAKDKKFSLKKIGVNLVKNVCLVVIALIAYNKFLTYRIKRILDTPQNKEIEKLLKEFNIEKLKEVINEANIKALTECFKEAKRLIWELRFNKDIAVGILNKLFEEISGNHGDHEITSEEKKKFLDFLKKIQVIFSEGNVKKLKNFNKKEAEQICMLAAGFENQLNGK